MDELVISCSGVTIRVVDDADTDLCERLLGTFPPEFTASPEGGCIQVSYVVTANTGAETDEQSRYAMSRDGLIVREAATDEDVFQWLWQDINTAVAQGTRQRLFVHAGVVGWRGLAIVIPGRSGTGKSTLVAELVRRGAVYYSDEFAVLDDTGMVHPYRRPLVLGEERHQPGDLRLERENASTEPLPVGVIVSGSYNGGTAWRPAVVRGTRAVLPLIDNTVLARDEAQWMLRIVARIAPDVVTLQGPRPEAAEVAAQLLDLVDDALISHASAASLNVARSLTDDLTRVAQIRLREAGRPAPAFRQLIAARYLRITDFFSPEDHQRLLTEAIASEEDFQESGVYSDKGAALTDHNVRKSRTLVGPRLEELWDMFAQQLHGILPAVRQELGIPWFPLGQIERQLTAHGSGGFFAPHMDRGQSHAATRRISCVYYFYASPRRFTGGELKLYDTWIMGDRSSLNASSYTTLAPLDNSVVFFPSDEYHEVCPVQAESDAFGDSRFTVTIWFHEGERTTEGTAAPR